MTSGFRPGRRTSMLILAVASLGIGLPGLGQQRGGGMHGPDFDLARITEWQVGADGVGNLTLADRTRWRLLPSNPRAGPIAKQITAVHDRAGPIFVAGSGGEIEDVTLPRPLSPSYIAPAPEGGRLKVAFHGPPSYYYLRTDRPWFAKARDLLREAAAQETAQAFPPPLMVSLDDASMEVMDVRRP